MKKEEKIEENWEDQEGVLGVVGADIDKQVEELKAMRGKKKK